MTVTGTQQRVYGTLTGGCLIDLHRFALVSGSTTLSPLEATTVTYADTTPYKQCGHMYQGFITLFLSSSGSSIYAATELRICKNDPNRIVLETYGTHAITVTGGIGVWFNKGSESSPDWTLLNSAVKTATMAKNEKAFTFKETKLSGSTLIDCCKKCPSCGCKTCNTVSDRVHYARYYNATLTPTSIYRVEYIIGSYLNNGDYHALYYVRFSTGNYEYLIRQVAYAEWKVFCDHIDVWTGPIGDQDFPSLYLNSSYDWEIIALYPIQPDPYYWVVLDRYGWAPDNWHWTGFNHTLTSNLKTSIPFNYLKHCNVTGTVLCNNTVRFTSTITSDCQITSGSVLKLYDTYTTQYFLAEVDTISGTDIKFKTPSISYINGTTNIESKPKLVVSNDDFYLESIAHPNLAGLMGFRRILTNLDNRLGLIYIAGVKTYRFNVSYTYRLTLEQSVDGVTWQPYSTSSGDTVSYISCNGVNKPPVNGGVISGTASFGVNTAGSTSIALGYGFDLSSPNYTYYHKITFAASDIHISECNTIINTGDDFLFANADVSTSIRIVDIIS